MIISEFNSAGESQGAISKQLALRTCRARRRKTETAAPRESGPDIKWGNADDIDDRLRGTRAGEGGYEAESRKRTWIEKELPGGRWPAR